MGLPAEQGEEGQAFPWPCSGEAEEGAQSLGDAALEEKGAGPQLPLLEGAKGCKGEKQKAGTPLASCNSACTQKEVLSTEIFLAGGQAALCLLMQPS